MTYNVGDRVRITTPHSFHTGGIGIIEEIDPTETRYLVHFDDASGGTFRDDELQPALIDRPSAFIDYTPQETPMPEPRTPKTGETWIGPGGRQYQFVSDEPDVHGYRIAHFTGDGGKIWAIVGPTELSVLTPPRPTLEEVLAATIRTLGLELEPVDVLAAHLREQFPELP